MEKMLSEAMKKKLLCIGGIKQEKKTKIGDKVITKNVIAINDALKSSVLYLGEDFASCKQRLPKRRRRLSLWKQG